MAVGAVVAVAAGVVLALGAGSRLSIFETRPESTKIARAPLSLKVKAQGTLESADPVAVSPPPIWRQWDFTITYMAPEGKEIEAGQPAVGFDTKRQRDDMQVQSSELAAARKELEKIVLEEQEKLDQLKLDQADVEVELGKARRKLEVPENLLARNDLAKARYGLEQSQKKAALNRDLVTVQEANLTARVEAAKAKVKQLEARLQETQTAMRMLTVPASRPGFVVYIPDWNNKKQTIGSNVWAGQPILEIADLSKMRVAAVVPEPDAGKVRVGQPVEVRLAASPDRLFRGKVQTLGRIFRTKSWDKPSIVFDATISIDDPDPALMRPGMAADVVILATTDHPVLQVPESAVRYGAAGAEVVVRGTDGDRSVPVRLGWRADGAVEVIEGLSENDVVVLRPAA